MKRARRLRTALTVLTISFILASQTALAASGNPQPTNPTGFADLLPTPDLTHGDTRTLFEQYSPMVYGLDFEKSITDPMQAVFNGYAHMMMMYIVAIVRGAISVGWWLFSFTDIRPLTETASGAIGGINTQLVGWLLPSALAFGAVAAYMQRRASGSAMGQLLWVLSAGVLATSFAVAPATWLNGVDGARQIGAQAVMEPSKTALGNTVQTPISWPEPSFAGSTRDTLLRKSADATWRGFVVTPWCIAEFGSLEACQRYGKAILDMGTDGDARKNYIANDIAKAEGGGNAATVKWSKGDNPFGRVGVLTLAAIAATMFAVLSIGLAFTALMAFVGCLLLLVVGVFFACLWIIPGRARQWGVNWFEALLGLVLQSVLAMLVFSATLTLITAVFSLTSSLGWLPVSGLAIAILVAAFRLRRLLESMTSMMRPGAGSMVMGGMARRGAMRAVRRIMGAVGSRAASPILNERSRDRTGSREAGTERSTSVRVFRQAPTVGAATRALPTGHASNELVSASNRRGLEAGGSPSGTAPSGSRGRLSQSGQTREGVGTGASLGATSVGSKSDVRRTLSVSASGVASPLSITGSQKGRDSRRTSTVGSGGARYEPRAHSHSASLRDGPPKAPRDRRRAPSAPQRRFRDYSSVTKDGVTVLVPSRR
ncbi:MAG: hypothetical protein QOG10_4907 [Kribbellaceae bacterium]|nr:hypothetical protein [Kribbellaceae bacterium]